MTASIAHLVADLSANPRPVLCLDTCDFLDVVRQFAEADKEANLYAAQAFRRALDALTSDPGRFQVVVTYLVVHEWSQNLDEARTKVDSHLVETARRVDRIAEACSLGRVSNPPAILSMSKLNLATALAALAEDLLNRSIVLGKDAACIERALDRVMDRRRPSHKREIKDSIHWEHYLELSRRLALAGHAEGRFFVSGNKADFWVNPGRPALHPDLEREADAAGLRFFGRLDLALRELGV